MSHASYHGEFPDLLRATADNRGLPVWIVEKDYYVTRALRALRDQIGDQFLFKGGTSLSKGWNLIERFSEDIDLLFQTEEAGQPLGKNQRHTRFKVAESIVVATPGFTLVKPEGGLSSETGMHRESWFAYTATHAPTSPVSDKIRLEMNCRGGREPHQSRSIQSFIAEFAAAQSANDIGDDLTPFPIECLDVTRTFAEKLFAAYYAFVLDRALGRTRHYPDLYQLAGLPEVQAFIASAEFAVICADVHRFSIEHWPDRPVPPGLQFAQYDFLAPTAEQLGELTRNYAAERILFFREPPAMTVILERLRQLPFPV
jgi:predicted nucleotidyltransferase component of viral defense system